MEIQNFGIAEVLGMAFFTGVLIFLILIFFEGLGKLKGLLFHISQRKR